MSTERKAAVEDHRGQAARVYEACSLPAVALIEGTLRQGMSKVGLQVDEGAWERRRLLALARRMRETDPAAATPVTTHSASAALGEQAEEILTAALSVCFVDDQEYMRLPSGRNLTVASMTVNGWRISEESRLDIAVNPMPHLLGLATTRPTRAGWLDVLLYIAPFIRYFASHGPEDTVIQYLPMHPSSRAAAVARQHPVRLFEQAYLAQARLGRPHDRSTVPPGYLVAHHMGMLLDEAIWSQASPAESTAELLQLARDRAQEPEQLRAYLGSALQRYSKDRLPQTLASADEGEETPGYDDSLGDEDTAGTEEQETPKQPTIEKPPLRQFLRTVNGYGRKNSRK